MAQGGVLHGPAHVFLRLRKDLNDVVDAQGDVEQDVGVGGIHVEVENRADFCDPALEGVPVDLHDLGGF